MSGLVSIVPLIGDDIGIKVLSIMPGCSDPIEISEMLSIPLPIAEKKVKLIRALALIVDGKLSKEAESLVLSFATSALKGKK